MKKLLIALLILAFLISPSLADTFEPLIDFETVHALPENMLSGYTYLSLHYFSSTHDTSIIVDFTVLHPDIEYDEWNVHFSLDGADIFLNETSPGDFTSEKIPISTGHHVLVLSVSSLPNIIPGQYGYEYNLLSEQLNVAPTATLKKSSSESISWITTTPTATPTPSPTHATTDTNEIVSTTTPEPTNITTIETFQAADYRPHIIVGGLLFLLIVIMSLIIIGNWKKKMNEENEFIEDEPL